MRCAMHRVHPYHLGLQLDFGGTGSYVLISVKQNNNTITSVSVTNYDNVVQLVVTVVALCLL